MLAHVGKKWGNFGKFKLIYTPIILKNSFFSWLVGGKNKNKSWKAAFFLVGDNFFLLEDSLTVKYSESGPV